MRFGVVGKFKYAETIKACGYDYIEALLYAIVKETPEEFRETERSLSALDLPVEATCCFLSGDVSVVADPDLDALRAYAAAGFARAAALGCKVSVFGSGKARAIPEGMSRTEGVDRFCRALDLIGTQAGKYGIRVAVEPLNASETNLVNTVAEGFDVVARCGNPHVGVLADFYHVFRSGESLDTVRARGGELFHAHIARANEDRLIPEIPRDEAAVRTWSEALRASGYAGRLSLEGKFDPSMEEVLPRARAALAFFDAPLAK